MVPYGNSRLTSWATAAFPGAPGFLFGFASVHARSMWWCDTSQKVLVARVEAESVAPQVRFEEIGDVGRSFLVGSFEKLEGFVVLTQAGVDDPDHIRRNVGDF